MALDNSGMNCDGDSNLRILFFTCAHQGEHIHKDEKPDERVDGRYALDHLWQLQLLAHQLEEADGIDTRIVCLGDMSTKESPDAWSALQAVKDRGIDFIVGNHDAYNFSRAQISDATGGPVVSHVQQMSGVANVRFNPLFNQEVLLVPGENIMPDGRDWADTFKDATKIIRNYIPKAHAEALESWFTEEVETGDFEKVKVQKKNKKGTKKVEVPVTAPRHTMIDAWVVASHNKPDTKPKFETANEAGDKILITERIKGPKTLQCMLPEGSEIGDLVGADDEGRFEMVHIDEVISELTSLIGKDKPYMGEYYGDEHPKAFKSKDNHWILPAFSAAQPGQTAQGYCLEVVLKDSQTTQIPHVLPYDEAEAAEAKEIVLAAEAAKAGAEGVENDEFVLA